MTPLVARLTWQAADPAALAADLVRRLGAPLPRDVELAPWLREAATDGPSAAGRLVFEPAEEGAMAPPPADGLLVLVGVAWATVELDRAEAELAEWLLPDEGVSPTAGGTGASIEPQDAAAARDAVEPGDRIEPFLGARIRARATSDLPGGRLVLAEPVTEGRLAASLARDGEGPCALYLRPVAGLDAWLSAAGARGTTVSRVAAGPFGRSVLVPGATVGGPHVIVVEASEPSMPAAATSTIHP